MFTLFLLVTVLVLSSSSNVYATETATNYNLSGTNKSTGYEYILEDSANFIDDAVKGRLISQMKKTTEYCNIAVVTTTSHPYGSTESYAVNTFEGYFGNGANGVIFVIDRDPFQTQNVTPSVTTLIYMPPQVMITTISPAVRKQ